MRAASAAALAAAMMTMTGPDHANDAHAGQPAAPGKITSERHPDTGATFTLSVPTDLDPARPAPLVLSLHYGGPGGPYYGRDLLESVVEPGLRALRPVVVAPDCPAPAWAGSPCETSALAVLDHVAGRFAVDTRRTLVTGYSKGGIGAWALAVRHPERFGAAIVMAGRPPASPGGHAAAVPVYAIHGAEDEVLPLAPVQAAIESLRAQGRAARLVVLPGVTHYETARFGAPLGEALSWLRSVWAAEDDQAAPAR